MRADVYVRLSLDRHGTELGIERQEQECRAYCERLGMEVGEVYADNDLSATSGVVRPAFERLLASKPEAIVCWHTDRFVRVTKDLERAIDLGVNIYAVHAGTFDLSQPAGRAVARTLTAWATYEGEQKALRQKSSHRQRAAQGRPFWHVAPFGYHKDGTLDPEPAERLRRLYSDLLEGKSVYSMAREMNAEGLTTTKGGKWTGPGLRQLLLSPRNAAISTYYEEELGPAQWEAIVSVDTFRAAQTLLTSPTRGTSWNPVGKKGGRKPSALLSGIASCGVCGSPARAWRGWNRQVYVCREGGCCTAPIDQTDSMVLRRVVEALGEDEVQRYWLSRSESSGDRAELLAHGHVLRGRLDDAATAMATGQMTVAQVARVNELVTKELADVEAKLAALVEPHKATELLADPEAMWEKVDGMELEDLRQLVQEVCSGITIKPRGKSGSATPFGWDYLDVQVRAE